ncbi:TPA: DUF3387 domain-containing protein, partial [Listeria monocytogenes]|nr:DUF3387 domain-containing protein [Listeria monocytogenes]
RQLLEKQFKNNNSNFQIAIVVDMWITGFDVPSLAVMYNDKPLKKHTLIQTISRVNRVFEGKDKGLVVDYIGIRKAMLEALKQYGGDQGNPIDDLPITIGIFRNQLAIIDDMLVKFDANIFYTGSPAQRLMTLNAGAEFVQITQELENRFMHESRKMKKAYEIVFPSGELTDEETERAQFYLAIRSIIYKQTKGDAPDAEMMNKVVQQMVYNAITSTGVEDIINNETDELFSQEVQDELAKINMPNTKFNALLKLLKQQIKTYSMSNKLKAIQFSERLKKVVEAYNNRDAQLFVSEVVSDFVDDLSEQLLDIMKELKADAESFEELGISYEEKSFYDILIKVRDDHEFEYSDENALKLAKDIKELVDDKAKFADWSSRDDIKNQLRRDLVILLHKNGYPPQWNNDIFEQVLEQAENFKKFS